VNREATAVALLREFRDRLRCREPDSDGHEYCRDCERSPYWQPQHKEGCIVPRLLAFLNEEKVP